ncbi:MAG: 2-hydroxyacid dehydrogenase [Acetobacteraceae bacterium]|nr:2-hydroxyacid dehydrogenase [Acetobacteraceae bacterium]
MRVVFDGAASPRLLALLSGVGHDVAICPPDQPAAKCAALLNADALWHSLAPVTARLLDGAPRLRLVQKIGTGVNTIDLDAARARGVAVCNLPGSNAPAVAEHALLLMLAALRRLPMLDRGLREGIWAAQGADEWGELGGRTVGLVGFGAVAQHLARLLHGFGCTVLAAARTPPTAGVERAMGMDALPELLAASDIVSLHLPLTSETHHLIDRAALVSMKPGAILVNTARGGLVDQAALREALASGRLAAAALDVFDPEPIEPDEPLLRDARVVATPHIAWQTPETWARSIHLAAENLRRLESGETLLHRVV